MENNRLYVLVRKDLSKSYQAVQAGHAVAEYMMTYKDWQNSTLIYLGVRDENHLIKWKNGLEKDNYKVVPFHEPDIDNQMTAFAVKSGPKRFKKLKLL